MATKTFKCQEPGCDYTAKTPGAVTQHVNKKHAGGDGTSQLRNKYGDRAPKAGGIFKHDKPLKVVPSGIPSLDYIMGIGGIPQGTLAEVFGPSKSGKTLTALAFSGHAQQRGGRIGYVDAEHSLQETFLKLIPELDPNTLEYEEPDNGEQAMNIIKDYVQTDLYAVWTVDSLHACIPKAALEGDFGDSVQRARLAQLMSEALPVIAQLTARTKTIIILINHVKTNPNTTFGKDWYTPGGSAPEFYSTVRLHVWAKGGYKNQAGVVFGHQVRVKLEKSKMSAPNAIAGYDIYYADGINEKGLEVKAGIDYASSWISVLKDEQMVTETSGGNFIDLRSGEKIGNQLEMREIVLDPESSYRKEIEPIIYPPEFNE